MKIDLIAGARPNFVKIASIIRAIENSGNKIDLRLIHTGQHYDELLSGSFFSDLNLPAPDFNLECGSGTQAQQTAAIMLAYEKLLHQQKTDLCLVVGDVTSSMACAVTAKKMNIKVAHVEAGIRSGDFTMPEEINRILIDSIADYFFTTTQKASSFLIKSGKLENQVVFVGNTMIDTLLNNRSRLRKPEIWDEINLTKQNYFVLTLHRPSNVDEVSKLKKTLLAIAENSRNLPVIFPVHPRTAAILKKHKLTTPNLYLINSLSYLEFNFLVQHAKMVITDSGGITEETTVLNIPCMTLRDNTERPETVAIGTNELVGTNPANIPDYLNKLFEDNWKKGQIPEYWDGKSGERIVQYLNRL